MRTTIPTKRLILWVLPILLIMAATTAMAKDKEHGFLGVMLQNVTGSMAKALQLDADEGVLINEVVEGSPAAEAGLEDGDVILAFGDEAINDSRDLTRAVRATEPGEKVDIEILRNGKRKTIEVELGEAQAPMMKYEVTTGGDAPHVEFFGKGHGKGHGKGYGNVWISGDDGEHEVIVIDGDSDFEWFGEQEGLKKLHLKQLMNEDRGFMGVELDDLNAQLGEYFGVDDGEGALVSKVSDDSPASEAGLRAGDVIVEIAGEDIESAGDVHAALAGTEPGQEVDVKVVRKGSDKTMSVTLGEAPEGTFSLKVIEEWDHDVPFPEEFTHQYRIKAPHSPRRIREVHRLHEDAGDLDEVRTELDKLREELKDLKQELKKEMKK